MVRTDNEDGGTLNSPDGDNETDGDDRQDGDSRQNWAAAVQRSSPLSRRRKSGRRSGSTTPAPEGHAPENTAPENTGPENTAPEEAGIEGPVPEGRAPEGTNSPSVQDDEATVSADDRGRGISYRDRRPSVKAPVGSGESSSRTVLVAVAMGLGAIVLVAAVVLSIVFAVGSARIDDQRELRANYDQFAQEVVVKLTTLNKENADDMLAFMNEHTSGRALQQMRESMKQATEMIREDDMKTKTTVVASAVEEADEDTGSVLVVFVWESTAPEAPDKPVVETFRSRIDITRINDDLKLTNFEWVG